jgi:hypothetical protein
MVKLYRLQDVKDSVLRARNDIHDDAWGCHSQ